VRIPVRVLALHLVRRVVWIGPRGLFDELLSGRTKALSETEACRVLRAQD
jgi:hypothetical protein